MSIKDSLYEALKALRPKVAKDAVAQERFSTVANQFMRVVLHNPASTRTRTGQLVDMFSTVFTSGLSWAPTARHVSLLTGEDGTLQLYVHYQGQIRLAGTKGVIERVTADLLYESDDFTFFGADKVPELRRKLLKGGLGEAIGGYTVSHLKTGGVHVELFDAESLQKAENAGMSFGSGDFWTGPHRREMQRKSLINATASRWLELSYTLPCLN